LKVNLVEEVVMRLQRDSFEARRLFGSLRAWVCVGSSATLLSCISSPETNSVVGNTQSPVVFQGVLPTNYGNSVTVQARGPNLIWVNLGTTNVNANRSWSLSAVVPSSSWFGPCGTAIVRAVSDQNQKLLVMDNACLDALPDTATQAEKDACASDSLVLHQEHVQPGDVTISTAQDATPYACVTRINGNLTVNNGQTALVALPNLHDVTGNVNVTLNRYIDFSTNPPTFVTGRFDSPILKTIGGNLELHNTKAAGIGGSSQSLFDFGLNAVTSVWGEIWVDNAAFPANIKALNALRTHTGDMLLDWGANDVVSEVLLSSLETQNGDLEIRVNPFARRMLHALTKVSGDLTLLPDNPAGTFRIEGGFLDALQQVGGDLTLERWLPSSGTCAQLAALTNLGGTLHIEQSGNASGHALGSSGAQHLSVGSLELLNGTGASLPFASDFEVRGAGSVTISDNPQLCQCTVDALLLQLQGAGWSGSATTVNNGAQASCMPCPVAATCP
jgi:hypothetical protein